MIKDFLEQTLHQLVTAMNDFGKTHRVFATNIFPPQYKQWNEDSLYWNAVAFYDDNVILEFKGKERKGMSSASMQTSTYIEPATEKQLKVIYENNLDVDTKDLTKLEAQKIIGKFFEQKDKESSR